MKFLVFRKFQIKNDEIDFLNKIFMNIKNCKINFIYKTLIKEVGFWYWKSNFTVGPTFRKFKFCFLRDYRFTILF